jgi:hypothetical protein
MLEMLLFVSVAVFVIALGNIIDKRSERAAARRRNQARPWR